MKKQTTYAPARDNVGCEKGFLMMILILILSIMSLIAQPIKTGPVRSLFEGYQPTMPMILNKPNVKHNSLYVALQPFDYGLGLRYDYTFKQLGLYTSISHGNYWFDTSHTQYIKDHNKYTLGISWLFPKEWGKLNTFSINGGINYHTVGSYDTSMIYNLNDDILYNQLSYELGCTVKFPKFAMGIRTDIPRWEPCFDFGISF